MRSHRVRQQGMTLIELMIVIAIIGLLAALTGPNLIGMRQAARLMDATIRVKGTLNEARSLALTQDTRICVVPVADPGFSNGDPNLFQIGMNVLVESGVGSSVWIAQGTVQSAQSWTNNNTQPNPAYRSVSLESNFNIANVDGCGGFLFERDGILGNVSTDFQINGGGAFILLVTRNKQHAQQIQRALWIDRGGHVQITGGPTMNPRNGT